MTTLLRTAGAARLALVLLISLTGCSLKDQFFGDDSPPPLPGQRAHHGYALKSYVKHLKS
jgi:hypothetical protein